MIVSMLVLECPVWRFGAFGNRLKWVGISSQKKFTVGEKSVKRKLFSLVLKKSGVSSFTFLLSMSRAFY
jgi:hypothetical protein